MPSFCSPLCGDLLIKSKVQCDDLNYKSGDGCSETCQIESGWTCTEIPSICTTSCGDGVKAGSEECDFLYDQTCTEECKVKVDRESVIAMKKMEKVSKSNRGI